MSLDPGSRLGPYQIVAPLGAGGMGQVYRARDPRLDREVAIKVIAAEHEPTDEQRQRFDREARAVAQLAHPHICSLFDVGHETGVDFLVIELLEGETLESRLLRGPLPIEQCLSLGASIASALAAAHARGIVHRDLKPANVMLTANGPKLLDFGLAKAFTPPSAMAQEAAAEDPGRLTGTGVVVGTVPYMAPEQIEGEEPDARTDIFGLGAILYEMVTGKPAFSGPNPVALAAAVVASDPPPISAQRPDTPPALARLIRTCLMKDAGQRWQSAHDVALQLGAVAVERDTAEETARPWRFPDVLPWALAAGALAIAGVAFARSVQTSPRAAPMVRFSVEPPPGGGIAWNFEVNPLALSPDGERLAFIASDSTGEQHVWLRPLSAASASPLPGTVGASSAMWSPDGLSIAFFRAGRLERIDLRDGQPVTIAHIGSRSGQSGTWGAKGDIVFAGVQGGAVYRVPAGGGTPQVLLRPDTLAGEARVGWPSYLADGERFLYTLRRSGGDAMLMLWTPDGSPRVVTHIESLAQWAEPGLIAFVRDGSLIGQAFDAGSGRVSGEPFAIAEGVRYFLSTGAATMATSAGGTLAFQSGRDLQRLVWLDRQGAELGAAGPTGNYLAAVFSPDAERLLTTRQEAKLGTWDIWVHDLERGTETPLTTARETETYGLWLADGRSVVYSVVLGGAPNLVRRGLASVTETKLHPAPAFQIASDVSPDGRTLLYRSRPADGTWDLWTMSLVDGVAPSPWLETPFSETEARFSPDGRYVAVISDETGSPELYVSSFAGPGEKIRVSTAGAAMARWPRESGEVIYVSPDRQVIAASIETRPTLRVGRPVVLFTLEAGTTWTTFDVTPDGRRLLAAIPMVTATSQPITVIANWASAAAR